MNNKILARSLLILSSLAVLLEGCYLFCLFQPESAFEEVLEQFVEDEWGADAFEEDSSEEYSAIFDESANIEKEF